MKITVLSMFRDSEKITDALFANLASLEANTSSEFEYFFYENDSTDNTKAILREWISNKDGLLKSEDLNTVSFSQSSSVERQVLMTKYRNRMLALAKPLLSEYTLILDSDVSFGPDLINQYLLCFDSNVAMVTPNVLQNIKCKMCDCGQDSYYDSFALIDEGMQHGLTWSHNPFVSKNDRSSWDDDQPVSVFSAFGGAALIKSSILNKVIWSTDGGCEHWNFCKSVRKFGKILVIPYIIASVQVGEDEMSKVPAGHITRVISSQKERISDTT